MVDLPPRGVWIANGNNVARWRAVVDLIEVHGTAEGKLIRLRLDGREHEIELGQQQADHLADLLKGSA